MTASERQTKIAYDALNAFIDGTCAKATMACDTREKILDLVIGLRRAAADSRNKIQKIGPAPGVPS